MPLTQIKMDQESITLSVGPGGLLAQIRMDASGVTISGTPVSQLMVQPSGITTVTPTVTVGFRTGDFRIALSDNSHRHNRRGEYRRRHGRRHHASGVRTPMPSRIRFATARSVFEAFPDLSYVAARPADDIEPLDHARALVGGLPAQATRFFSSATCFLAARRFGGLLSAFARSSARAPRMRLSAPPRFGCGRPRTTTVARRYRLANDSDRRKPTTWLAFAAGWSGGSLLPADQKPVPPPAGACAMAANTAIMMAVAAGDPRAVVDRIGACAEAGVRFASGGEPTVFGLARRLPQ